MHRIFQTFIDRHAESVDLDDLHEARADAAAALDLCCFAYLSMPHRRGASAAVTIETPTPNLTIMTARAELREMAHWGLFFRRRA